MLNLLKLLNSFNSCGGPVDKWGIVRGQLSLCRRGAVWVYFHRAKVFEIL